MVDPEPSRFWQAALRSGLIDARGLWECWGQIPEEKRTAEAAERRLARQAVQAGRLTAWQAQQIMLGRWQGLKIGKYELLDVIGRGGMGRVYLARDTRLGRQVAMKVLSRERMESPRALARFDREARVGAQLQHANLIRVYDVGEVFGLRYLVMEYVAGRSVAELVLAHGRLPPPIAAELARQVALGLDHLHRKGLLHRDVTPSNILVDLDGTAKLTDLGLAIDLGDEELITVEGSTVGTFDYISPEQTRSSRRIDIRSDLYALGCTLYHMIAGRVPFPAATMPERLAAHQLSEPEPLAALAPDCPPGLEAVVRRLMRKRPEDRYPDPQAVVAALEPFASGPAPLERIEALAGGVAVAAATPRAGAVAVGSGAGAAPAAGPSPPPAGPASTSDPDVFFVVDLDERPPMPEGASRVTTDAPARGRRWPALLGLALLLVALIAGAAWLWS